MVLMSIGLNMFPTVPVVFPYVAFSWYLGVCSGYEFKTVESKDAVSWPLFLGIMSCFGNSHIDLGYGHGDPGCDRGCGCGGWRCIYTSLEDSGPASEKFKITHPFLSFSQKALHISPGLFILTMLLSVQAMTAHSLGIQTI